MKIALIYPDVGIYREVVSADGYVQNMRKYPPLSLAYVASIIRRAGHEVIIIDGNILKLDLKSIVRELRAFAPGMLGFTVTLRTFLATYKWICALKKELDIPVIVGGAILEIYPKEIMSHQLIDYALIGTAESTLPEFLSAYENKKDFSTINGLCYRKDNQVILNKKGSFCGDINNLPLPARDLLPNHRYQAPFSEGRNFTAFLTSRGCIFKCLYCCQSQNLQVRSTEDVLRELEECFHRFGIRDIDFYDPVFTADKSRTIEICRQIRSRKLKLRWSARTHISLVDEEILKEMSSSGCRMVMYGIESVSPRILENLGRIFIPLEQIRGKISLTRKCGISSFGFFMLGSPGETEETIQETVAASRKLGLDFAQFTRLTPLEGTLLYERYVEELNDDPWRRLLISGGTQGEISSFGTTLTQKDIFRYVRKANIGFYFRPVKIARMSFGIRSPGQLMNFTRAASNMLFSYLLRNI